MARRALSNRDIRRLIGLINKKNIVLVLVFGFALQGFWYWQSLQTSKQVTLAGMPKVENIANYKSWFRVLNNDDFLIGYSDYRLNPLWVAYKLQLPLKTSHGERPSGFDTDWRSIIKVSHSDYTGSGFDRGHLAPNYAIARNFGRSAQLKTFLMTNISPQKANLNRGAWKELEIHIVDEWLTKNQVLWIQTGGIFETDSRLKNTFIAIPDAFYKIIATFDSKDKIRVIAFVLSQSVDSDADFADYAVSVDFIEQNTGLDFFANLSESEQIQIETGVDRDFWFKN